MARALGSLLKLSMKRRLSAGLASEESPYVGGDVDESLVAIFSVSIVKHWVSSFRPAVVFFSLSRWTGYSIAANGR